MFYVNLTVTTKKQQPMLGSQKIKRKESKHTTTKKSSLYEGKHQGRNNITKEL